MAKIDSYRPRRNSFKAAHWSEVIEDEEGNPPSRTLFIGNVPPGTKGDQIRFIFDRYGEIKASSPASFAEANRGYAFITYEDTDSAKRAIFSRHRKYLFRDSPPINIRFTQSHQQPKASALISDGSRVSEARSEWFQPSVTRKKEQESRESVSAAVAAPESMEAKMPPTAPRAMLARRTEDSPAAPSSMRIDVSPPPLRRTDSYMQEPRSFHDRYRREEYDERRSPPGRMNYERGVNRYMPGSGSGDGAVTLFQYPEKGPYSHNRDPTMSDAAVPSPLQHMDWFLSSSLLNQGDTRSHLAVHGKPGSSPVLPAAESVIPQIDGLSGSAEMSDARPVSRMAGATIAPSLRAIRSPSTESKESTISRQTPLGETSRHLQPLSRRPSSRTETVITAQVDVDMQAPNLPAITVHHIEQPYGLARSPGSTTVQRLRVSNDDNSSIASSSTKASQRKTQCAYCKAAESSVSPFTKCSSCSRRYHAACGDPSPFSTKHDVPFTCGSCLRKSKLANASSTRSRHLSPELGTPHEDIAPAEVSAFELISLSRDPDPPPAPQPRSPVLNTASLDYRGGSETDFPKETVHEAMNHRVGRTLSSIPTVQSTASLPEVSPCHRRDGSLDHKKDTVQGPGDVSPNPPVITPLAARPECPISFGGGEKSNGPVNEMKVNEPPSMEEQFTERTSATQNQNEATKANDSFTTQTKIQERAARTAAQYKSVTCLHWKYYSNCMMTAEHCMFAHRDTGIDAPHRERLNRFFTCYDWMNQVRCRDGDRCIYAHQDTGLYVGRDGLASKKHITCTFWQRSRCRWAAHACLFAHEDTGIYAEDTKAQKLVKSRRENADSRHKSRPAGNSEPAVAHSSPRPMRSPAVQCDNLNQSIGPVAPSSPATKRSASRLPRKVDNPMIHTPTREDGKCRSTNDLYTKFGMRASSISDSLDHFSAQENLYSPKDSLDGNIDLVHSLDTSFSPKEKVVCVHGLVRGVDTPFSPNSSPKSVGKLEKSTETEVSSSPYSPPADIIRHDTSPKAIAISKQFMEQPSINECGEGEANSAEPLRSSPPHDPAPIETSKLERHTEPKLQAGGEQASTILRANPCSSSRRDTEKTSEPVSTPTKHFAKRSMVDPRRLKRGIVKSVTANTTSQNESSTPHLKTVKHCERCNKRIMGSMSLCTGCRGAFESRADDASNVPPDDGSIDGKSAAFLSFYELAATDDMSDDIGSFAVEFMESNVAKSMLSVAKKLKTGTEPAKTLKRANDGNLFIQKKRPRIEVPLNTQKSPAMTSDATDDRMKHLKQTRVDLTPKVNNAPHSLEELTRMERQKKGILNASEASIDERNSVETQEGEEGNKENRRSSFGSGSQLTKDRDAGRIQGAGSASKVVQLQDRYFTNLPSQKDPTPMKGQSEPRSFAKIDLNSDKEKPLDSEDESGAPKEDSMLKDNMTLSKPRQPLTRTERCQRCTKSHKPCLHDNTGEYDPALCKAYLENFDPFSKRQGSFNSRYLAQIRDAAARLRMSEQEYEVSPDVDNESDKDHVEDKGSDDEPFSPAASTSSENPLVEIMNTPAKTSQPTPDKLEHAASENSRADQAMNKSTIVQASIPTPAQTPSPANSVAESLGEEHSQKEAIPKQLVLPDADEAKVLTALRRRGVKFDSESESDSDEEMDEVPTSSSTEPRISALWPKKSSRDLFEVAPLLRPPIDSLGPVKTPNTATANLRARLSKKKLWRNLLSIQCEERRAKFGNPHKMVERDLPSQTVNTTVLMQHIPERERTKPIPLQIPELHSKKKMMPFEQFLQMPEEPVVVRDRVVRNKHGKVEFDLAYRDGKKDRERGLSLGGRTLRESNERWPFTRG